MIMDNIQKLFDLFFEKISLSQTQKESLQTSRNAIRDRIIKYFKEELKKKIHKFIQQGSFASDTIIKPILGKFDLDYGLYIDYKELKKENDTLIKTETVHDWVAESVKDHTFKIEDRKNCVRIIYASDNYYVDIPIYSEFPNGKLYLARKGEEQWIESDPKLFMDWFDEMIAKHGEQARRVIKYLKAWNDFKDNKIKSILMTVLAMKNFSPHAENDSKAILETVKSIIFELTFCNGILLNPVDHKENLLGRYSDPAQIAKTMSEKFTWPKEKCEDALQQDDMESSCKKWMLAFGDRFPLEKNKSSSKSSSIHIESYSRPYGTK
jgi:hypothetical protein